MKALISVSAIALAALTLACGTRAPDLEKWNTLSQEIRSSVQDYRTSMATAPTRDQCEQMRATYLAEVQPRMEEMQAMSGDMDGCMRALSSSGEADVETTCGTMDDELARYMQDGCNSDDPATNQTNAYAHCDYMLQRLDSTDARSTQMMGMMDSGMMSGGTCGQ